MSASHVGRPPVSLLPNDVIRYFLPTLSAKSCYFFTQCTKQHNHACSSRHTCLIKVYSKIVSTTRHGDIIDTTLTPDGKQNGLRYSFDPERNFVYHVVRHKNDHPHGLEEVYNRTSGKLTYYVWYKDGLMHGYYIALRRGFEPYSLCDADKYIAYYDEGDCLAIIPYEDPNIATQLIDAVLEKRRQLYR